MSRIRELQINIQDEEDTIDIIAKHIKGYEVGLRQAMIERNEAEVVHLRDRISSSETSLRSHKANLKKLKKELKKIKEVR